MPLVAGVDSSTQSTKVEVRDVDSGEVVARAAAPHPAATPPRSEQDPAAWWSAFEAAWATIGAPEVAAISVAGQQHGMVVLDADRRVVRPAKLWNDTESAPDAGWLWKQLDGGRAAWAEAVGSVPLAAFTVTKLSWLHRSEPDAWARLAHVVLPHDWMTHRLTGRLVTDRGDASGTGYWSPALGEYRWDLLAVVDRDRDWSTVVPEVLGPLEVAGSWSGAVVAPGTGDNMAAALALLHREGDVLVSLGTSGTVSRVAEVPTADATGAVAGFADATGRFLPLVCTANAAKVLDTVGRWIGADHDELDALALSHHSGGTTLLPYFDGERTPDLPDATAELVGLRHSTGRGELARAAVEGVVCHLLEALDALERVAGPASRVILTGGGARSSAVRSLFAGLCDRPVVTAPSDEAVATGAALQAAAVLGQEPATVVAARWGLDRVEAVEAAAVDREEVRARFAAARERATRHDG